MAEISGNIAPIFTLLCGSETDSFYFLGLFYFLFNFTNGYLVQV
ncbi:hypothetical protein RU96_GL001595 [Enterococcus canintestini]|uniref:Uncharacterized protein n=1 Tax=Enterococcus canintestini TaxID=317010 RepID=A0A1L8R8M0_9ENTE|nr:hypothetical protein RU96_GL001595 [Enterococcus canintestini]